MLRTNLSTRPFYNERAVHGLLGLTILIVVALTVFNLTQVMLLSRRQSEMNGRADAAEARARDLRTHAAQMRQAVNAKQLDQMSESAREANAIISQRLFSWTDLLNRLETTVPDDVRITVLRPRVERDGSVTVQMTVTARSLEDVDLFMANLEETGAFTGVFPREDAPMEDGLVQAMVEGKYAPAP
jgi:Tfp pilus assembly protein PilN